MNWAKVINPEAVAEFDIFIYESVDDDLNNAFRYSYGLGKPNISYRVATFCSAYKMDYGQLEEYYISINAKNRGPLPKNERHILKQFANNAMISKSLVDDIDDLTTI